VVRRFKTLVHAADYREIATPKLEKLDHVLQSVFRQQTQTCATLAHASFARAQLGVWRARFLQEFSVRRESRNVLLAQVPCRQGTHSPEPAITPCLLSIVEIKAESEGLERCFHSGKELQIRLAQDVTF